VQEALKVARSSADEPGVKRVRYNVAIVISFALVAALCVSLLGLALGREVNSELKDQVVSTSAASVAAIVTAVVQPAVTAAAASSDPDALAKVLDNLAAAAGPDVSGVTVRDAADRTIVSLGAPTPSTRSDRGPVKTKPGVVAFVAGDHVHVVSPLQLVPGAAAGSIDVEIPNSAIEASVAVESRDVYNVLALGLGALFLALLPFVLLASRRLRSAQDSHAQELRVDVATSLPNRAAFYEHAEALLASPRAADGAALVLIDLDRFKEINDSLGHDAGDEVLKDVAARLRHALRDGDMLARLGGDEFAILFPSVPDAALAERIAWKISEQLNEPFTVQGIKLDIAASMGIALAPDHGDDIQMLMRRADVAMYAAKHAHAGVNVYDAAEDPNSADSLSLIADLRTAIEAGGLELHYQPKAVLQNGFVESVEALCRWTHAERGFISPGVFIPIAEQTGLVKPLTLWVVDEALRQAREWRREGIGLSISVNISAQNLKDPRLTDDFSALLAKYDAEADWITLEVTESAVMEDPEIAIARLDDLAGMGLEISIDDYGTGYSSLAYLKRLPISELKIDRSFVMNITSDQKDALIIGSTVELGHNLGLRVVAEGVEQEADWIGLQMLGCDIAQGYFLGRPMPAAKLREWLAEPGREYAKVPAWRMERMA
jgi:diguanylate cyclase (GGDEF)-like protein